ncbi:hypothetical protein OAD24_15080 [Pseudomonadales bacterium]|nr:hypothetical protein [Pseudomonadales bacterium]
MELDRGFCETCDKTVRAHNVKKIDHWQHLFLSLLTVGLWVTPWVIIAVMTKPIALCFACGDKLKPLNAVADYEFKLPIFVRIRKWIFRFVLLNLFIVNIFLLQEDEFSISAAFFLVYGFCAIYTIIVKCYEGSIAEKDSGLFNFINYSFGFGIFGGFAWLVGDLRQTLMVNESIVVDNLPYILVCVLVATAISTFMVMAVSTNLDHKSRMLKEDVVVAVTAILSYILMIYLLINPEIITTDPSWWKMGLIGLVPLLGLVVGSIASSFIGFGSSPKSNNLELDDSYFPDFKKFGKFFKQQWKHGFSEMIGDSNELNTEFEKLKPVLDEVDPEYEFWQTHFSNYHELRSTLRQLRQNSKVSKKEIVSLQSSFNKLDGAPFFLLNEEILEMLEWVKNELSNTYEISSETYIKRVKRIEDFQYKIQNFSW